MRPGWSLFALVLLSILSAFFIADASEGPRSGGRTTVVVDAGHGGVDPGAIGWNGVTEKQVNLEIARLVEIMALNEPDFRVVLTRRADKTISLRDRIDLAHRLDAGLYVSIHANAHHDARAEGFETLAHDTPSESNYSSSLQFARVMDDQLTNRLSGFAEQRGIREQRLYLQWARIPAIIVEAGFLTNPTEAERLQTLWYQAQVAQSIVGGIKAYLRQN